MRELGRKNTSQKGNIENLMEELQAVSETNERLSSEYESLKSTLREITEKTRETEANHVRQCEELVSETMKKDQALFNL